MFVLSLQSVVLVKVLMLSLSCFFLLMIRRPPRSTRTDTLVPYTTLFRSNWLSWRELKSTLGLILRSTLSDKSALYSIDALPVHSGARCTRVPFGAPGNRSEERRVGKECVITCRSRWSPYH